jgi:hypothetical protein
LFLALVSSRYMTKIFILSWTCVFRNGASSLMKEGLVFLCTHYFCCTTVSERVYTLSLCPGHYGLCILCHCTILSNISTRYTEVFCQWRLVQHVMP